MANLTISNLIGTLKSTFKISLANISSAGLTANRTIAIPDKNITIAGLDDLTALASTLNPIGTIRSFNVSTNPNTLLGFGTWAAFGTGRVTVAIDASQTEFDTNGETGGEKTHLLTSAESGVPAHTHPLANGQVVISGGTGAPSAGIPGNGSAFKTTSIDNNASANASSAHNNLQPYIVVYRWVRTA